MTQNEAVKAHMETYGSITSMEAFEMGISRLSARIGDLRKMGVPVITRYETTKNRYGNTCTYARYSIEVKDNG